MDRYVDRYMDRYMDRHMGKFLQLLQKPIAAVQQLRGELPDELIVPGAKLAMASNGGAGALFCDVLLVGKEQP